MSDTLIIQLREAINCAENMVPFMRSDMLDLMESAKYEIETLTDNLKQLREERDEARREICERQPRNTQESHQHAIQRGWDCFKEETP